MKSFDAIYEVASGTFGLVTARQALALGVSSRELSRWVRLGRLEHSSRGVYRLSTFPASQFDTFAAAVEAVGEDAYLFGESVIGMLGLTATNPTWIHIATPCRIRKRLSDGIVVHKGENGYQFTYYEGVRSQRVADAILTCKRSIRLDRLLEALSHAVVQGYVGRDEARRIRSEVRK